MHNIQVKYYALMQSEREVFDSSCDQTRSIVSPGGVLTCLCEKKQSFSHRRRADDWQRQQQERSQDYDNVIPVLPQRTKETGHIPQSEMDIKDFRQPAVTDKFPRRSTQSEET